MNAAARLAVVAAAAGAGAAAGVLVTPRRRSGAGLAVAGVSLLGSIALVAILPRWTAPPSPAPGGSSSPRLPSDVTPPVGRPEWIV